MVKSIYSVRRIQIHQMMMVVLSIDEMCLDLEKKCTATYDWIPHTTLNFYINLKTPLITLPRK